MSWTSASLLSLPSDLMACCGDLLFNFEFHLARKEAIAYQVFLNWESNLFYFFKDFFPWCGPFLKSLLNLLQYCFCLIFFFFICLFFWPRGMWEPEGLQSTGLHRVGHDWSDLACTHACRILAPWPGIEPAPFALEGKVLVSGPPGKSWESNLIIIII